MLLPALTTPVLQLHPTRRCNLRCLHCYSNSAPAERYEQDVLQLVEVVGEAANQGYRVVSISGGEPLLYSGLSSLLTEARRLGMRTTVTTNGLLLNEGRTEMLAGLSDFLAISLDGAPERHNYLRNAAWAFELMQQKLERVRQSGLSFGFLFTLTHENLADLEWVAEFAVNEGAEVLQIHALEETGRARSALTGQAPTDIDATLAWLIAERLKKRLSGKLRIHLDLINREALRCSNSSRRKEAAEVPQSSVARLADFISPLVIETDGTVVPLQYGFPRAYALGNLNERSLEEVAVYWSKHLQPDFAALYECVLGKLAQPAELPFVNWYEFVACAAREIQQTPLRVLTGPSIDRAHAIVP
jgi:Fe-coproporphyrin III synthase